MRLRRPSGASPNGQLTEESRHSGLPWDIEELLTDLYDLSRAPDCWQRFLTRVCVGLKAAVGVIVKRDPGQPSEQVIAVQMPDGADRARLHEAWAKHACTGNGALPLLPPCENGNHGEASVIAIDLEKSGAACSLRSLGVGPLMYARKGGEGHPVLLAVGRLSGQPCFDELDLNRFAKVTPHFEWAFQLAELFAKLTANVNASTAVLDLLPTGVIILDEQGACVTMNRAARETLDPDGTALRLIKRSVPRNGQQEQGTENASAHPQILSLPGRTTGHRSVAVLWDVGGENSDQQRKLAFIMDPDHQRSADIDVAALQHIYGLTATEARVAALVAESRSVAEIAERLGSTAYTVRTHLRHIFEKTGTERQVDLVHLLLQSPLALRHPRRSQPGRPQAEHHPEKSSIEHG